MATDVRSIVLGLAIVVLVLAGVYLIDPTFFGMYKAEGFQAPPGDDSNSKQPAEMNENKGEEKKKATESNTHSAGGDATASAGAAGSEGFGNFGDDGAGPADFGSATGPAGCYPRDQLTPSELLPRDMNSIWAEQNPMGPGSLKGKNFLSAGALIGVNTVGQSLRNANLQIRSEPPNPQVPISIFNQSTIAPDISHRPLEIGP